MLNITDMKVAVTTASGNLGSTVIKTLKKEIGEQNVVGIARTPAKAEYLQVEIRKGDYNSLEDFVKALQGVDAVLIVSNTGDPKDRVAQHRNIIEGAKENGLKNSIYKYSRRRVAFFL